MIQYPRNYVVWDLETSGLNPDTDKILEIGYAIVKDGVVESKKSMLLKQNIKVPEIITEITGIRDMDLEMNGIDPKLAIEELLSVLTIGMPNVTHNGLKFDLPFLLSAIYQMSLNQRDDHSERDLDQHLYKYMIDTAVLFKASKSGRMRRVHETFADFGHRVMEERIYGLKYNVKVCCEELGIPPTEQHRALADVLLTNQIYQKLCLSKA